jgi:hypothetical protein
MPNTYTLIASNTVGSGGVSSVTFSSIPSTYTDLLIKLSARCDNAGVTGNMAIEFNSSSSSFSRKIVRGNGSAASSTGASDNYIGDIVGNAATSSTFSNTDIYIPNYAGSNNKSLSIDTVTENNATEAWQYMVASLWSDSSAITSIKLTSYAAHFTNFLQYSTFYLYGIKNS